MSNGHGGSAQATRVRNLNIEQNERTATTLDIKVTSKDDESQKNELADLKQGAKAPLTS